jgi:hypothetical protein
MRSSASSMLKYLGFRRRARGSKRCAAAPEAGLAFGLIEAEHFPEQNRDFFLHRRLADMHLPVSGPLANEVFGVYRGAIAD